MQTLIRTRQQMRDRVQACEFAELNRSFDALESQWQQAPPGECPVYLEAVQGDMLVDWDAGGSKALTQVLKAWIEACPKAYHPQVVMGFHCFNRACDIRGTGAAQEVSDARWLAAEQACEIATAHFMRALERSEQPIAAAIGMLLVSAHFREPGWLVELFHGQAARFRPSAHADVEVQEAVAPLLVKFGLVPLVELPQALPDCLSPRLFSGQEGAHDYWLRHTLAWRDGCFEAVERYARYLAPRWGGSHEAIERVASGPLCRNWGEAQRNAIRWLILEDRLHRVQAEQWRDAAQWLSHLDAWMQRELRPRERALLLAWRGGLRVHSLDFAGATQDFVAFAGLCPEQGFGSVGGWFYSVAQLVLHHPTQEADQAFRVILEGLCLDRKQAAACALRAIGHQFGYWGFQLSLDTARQWVETAVKRQCWHAGQCFEVLDVPGMLRSANLHDAAYYLYEQCAELKMSDAAMALHELHQGKLDKTPAHYLNAKAAQHWLLCAAEAGDLVAKYELACQRMQDNEGLRDRTAMLAVRRLLLDATHHAQVGALARLQLGILLRRVGDSQERVEAVEYLSGLLDYPDKGIAARACAEMGLAWMYGHGTRKQSRFAAIEWANRAVTLQPNEPAIAGIQAEILNSHSVVKTLFTVCGATLFRGDLQASELPPKAASPQQQRASA
ncbi:DUF4034 domain-containing protein [Pseudomonas sp. PSKL.D1]|uniref:DUF4034 domain-containing protein n=1 Tax=Pseudomonas sp. PSKL.D1 TaxID=3029060 RepID=UPI0023813C71|nr:DUF4034 domain-containing protein [Pseudomonas sp. PSKL.D1]WDY57872.1 DUF4034 domain-containing protein [Pseudomonas sp. PSKL.D1]